MSLDQPSPMLLAQRVRNNIIAGLELFASYEDQRDYELRVPIAYVPAEVCCGWSDWVDSKRLATYTEPVFSLPEQAAMRAFDATFESFQFPRTPPTLAELQNTVPWDRLRQGALIALAVFRIRGKFDENREVFSE